MFRAKNKALMEKAIEVLEKEKPMTLRQLYYRLISAGALQNSQKEYARLGKVMTRLREDGIVPRRWMVDHVRSTLKPSSWSGLADFGDTVKEAYRKDFWASLPHHVELFVEKDAIAGTIQPVTYEYDIPLRVCRGYSSISFAGEIADEWAEIEKPIFAYYLGDFDPSGFDLERDLAEKLERYSGLSVHRIDVPPDEWADQVRANWQHAEEQRALGPLVFWTRLAVRIEDFEDHDLIPLPVKIDDNRANGFIKAYGEECAEVDALAPRELRARVKNAIEAHIDQDRWKKLQETERLEQATLDTLMEQWRKRT